MAQAHEILYWLSGGAGNTDPAAALGGVRSTAQQTGFQNRSTSTPIVGTTVLDGSIMQVDGSLDVESVDIFPDIRVQVNNAPIGTTETEFTVPGPAGVVTDYCFIGNEDSRYGHIRITGDFVALQPGLPDSAPVVFSTPDNNLLRHIVEEDLAAGITIYRCFYVLNNSVDLLSNHVLDVDVLVDDSGTIIEVGLDPAGVNASAQVIADEETAPIGVTFGDDTGLFTLDAGDFQAVWVRYQVPLLTTPTNNRMTFALNYHNSIGSPTGLSIFANTLFQDLPFLEDEVIFTDTAEAASGWPEEALVFADQAVAATGYPEDSLEFTDEAVAQKIMYEDLVDDILLDDVESEQKLMYEDLIDAVSFTDEANSRAIFNEAIVETLSFGVTTNFVGGSLEGWVLNLTTGAPSHYEWGPFTSFARFGGKHYAISEDGVFLLEGDTDDGVLISSFILSGLTDLGDEFKKRIKAVYLGVRSTGNLLLKVVADEQTYVYTVQTSGMDALKRVRGTVGLGLYGNYWQFGLEPAAGIDFELESIKILPLVSIVDGRRKD
ncbi:MAG: hypothetical protein ACREJC_02025 [Tepidisphaeraceae bacterium]